MTFLPLVVQAIVRLITTCALILVCDLLFIGRVMRDHYKQMFIRVQQGKEVQLRLFPALLASILVAIGLWMITLLDGKPWNLEYQKNAFVFGVSVFGIYNLTNLATLQGWSPMMAAIDTTYGTILCTTVYAVGTLIPRF